MIPYTGQKYRQKRYTVTIETKQSQVKHTCKDTLNERCHACYMDKLKERLGLK